MVLIIDFCWARILFKNYNTYYIIMNHIDKYMTEKEYDLRVGMVKDEKVKNILREYKKEIKANDKTFIINVNGKIKRCKLV